MTIASTLEGITHSQFKHVCTLLVEAMEAYQVPGVTIGIQNRDKEYVAGFGITSVENPLAVTPDTLFRIGSVTKTFTGTLAMTLVEEGRLDLDTPIQSYMPNFRLSDRETTKRVTMHHLLTHVGGWSGDYFDDSGEGDDALAIMVERIARLPQIFPLGAYWSYNNTGFQIAGRVIETITGQTFESVLQERILDPLSMSQTFIKSSDVITHRFAVGHEHLHEAPRPVVNRPYAIPRARGPVGRIISTVADLLKYARFHMGESGNHILSPEGLQYMQSMQVEVGAGTFDATGLTWMISKVGNDTVVGHSGGTKGQRATLMMVPEKHFAIIILTNSSRDYQLHNTVNDAAFKTFLGIKPAPKPEPIEMTKADLLPYVGEYDRELTHIRLTIKDGKMMAHITPKGGYPTLDTPPPPALSPVELNFYGDDRVGIADGAMKGTRGEFIYDDIGRLFGLRFADRILPRSVQEHPN